MRDPRRQSCISDRRCRRSPATYPGVLTRRAVSSSPIWSCSGWGLPCHFRHRKRGELLPRRFTLTSACALAVYFLWHFPWDHSPWPLTSTLPCGARTFLGPPVSQDSGGTRLPPRLLTLSRITRQSGVVTGVFGGGPDAALPGGAAIRPVHRVPGWPGRRHGRSARGAGA